MRVTAYILLAVSLAACGSTSVRTIRKADPKPDDCQIEIFGAEGPARERGALQEVCAIDASAGAGFASIQDLAEDQSDRLCECGADGAWILNGTGPQIGGDAATVSLMGFRWVEGDSVSNGSHTSAAQQPAELIEAASLLLIDLRPIGGIKESVAQVVTKLFLSELSSVQKLRAQALDDFSATLSVETTKDSLGCDDVTCAAELAGALGVDFVGYGEVGQLGDQYTITLSVVGSRDSRVVARASSRVPADETALADALPGLVSEVISGIAVYQAER